ncbi:MAG: winged helix-turn-helix transcriptional regulator, partial [Clostridia bacterium]|nr:winged helix-turn-helix transcriptional regulator [Clostridia bacterium]
DGNKQKCYNANMNIYANKSILLDAKTSDTVVKYTPTVEQAQKLCDFLSALGDETRLRIISALAITPMCVGDISSLLQINQTTVSHQLKTLKSVGAVKCRRQGRISFYSLSSNKVVRVLDGASDCI